MATVFFWFFGALGAISPYLTLYYKEAGLTGSEISVLISIWPLLLLVSQPIFGPLTDRSGHRGRMLAWLLAASAGAGLFIGLSRSFWSLLPLVTVWGFFSGPIIPISDSIALGESSRTGVAYPRLRLWGSIGWLMVTSSVGWLYSYIGLRWAFVAFAAIMLVAWRSAWRLPAEGLSSQKPLWPDLRKLVTNPRFLAFLLTCGVVQFAHSGHTAFFSIRLQEIGGSNGMVGLGWGLAGLAEIPVWLVLGAVSRRVGPLPLLSFSAASYAVRWWLYGAVGDPGLLVVLQVLQAVTYAIFMPTAVVHMGELTPADLRTSGQALLGLVSGGLATVSGILTAGWAVDRWGTTGLYVMNGYIAAGAGMGFVLLMLWQRGRRPDPQP